MPPPPYRKPMQICALALGLVAGSVAAIPARPLAFDDFVALGRVSDPQLSPDGRSVVFVVTRYSTETNKGNSDIYSIPLAGGDARQLTRSPAADTHPRFSPDGGMIAFQSSRSGTPQVWVLPADGGEAYQVTHMPTGASAPRWTPDGTRIVFTSKVFPDCSDPDCNQKRLDEADASLVQARVYTDLLFRHWDEWRDDRRRHVFVIPARGGEATDLTPGARDYPTLTLGSSHDIDVSPDGGEICVTANEGQNLERNINNDLFTVSLDTGTKKQITENPANDNQPVYSPNGKFIAYRAMTRPGFEADQYRLMIYDRGSGESREASVALAKDLDRSVTDIAWAPNGRHLYVTSRDRGYMSLYRIDTRSGDAEQLTHGDYIDEPRVAPDGKSIVFLSESATQPYEIFVSTSTGSKAKQLSHVNDDRLAGIEMNPLEPFSFEGAGGTPVHGFLLKPPGFDAARRYPLVFLVHGGPQGAWSDNFHWRWNAQMFASPGYVTVMINPRGSTGYGQAFTDEISRDWGDKPYTDLMNGLDYVLDTYEFIDKDRIAAAGGSYGGYMVNWIAGHTDRFRCLVNHDGLFNLVSFYGTTEELWFPEWDIGGTPWEQPDNYARYSPHVHAAKFKTPMLVVHGGKDYRVDPSEGFQTFTALRRQDVPAKLLYFPDEGHWVLKPLNMQLWWRTVHGWLAEWLK